MLNHFSFNKLENRSSPNNFDCNDHDLNDFFINDAINYHNQLMAVTYYFEDGADTVAYFSVLNDKIINKDTQNKTISNQLTKNIPNDKRRPIYPSVKVGRLAVNKNYQSQGLGSELLTFIKCFFTYKNKTGCRFIAVDAYNLKEIIDFYKKNHFKFLTDQDKNEKTRLMYFDLINLIPY